MPRGAAKSSRGCCWGSHLRRGAKTPIHEEALAVKSKGPEAKPPMRRPRSEVASTKTPLADARLSTPILRSQMKVPKRRYKGGWEPSEGVADSLGEGPDMKAWSMVPGGEGS